MSEHDHDTYRRWLDLEMDGQLAPGEQRRLDRHVAACRHCRDERQRAAALAAALEAGRVEVRADFRESVMASLPPAAWEARSPRSLGIAAALAALLAVAAAVVAGLGGSLAEAAGPAGGVAAALLDLLSTSALAGAGLLAASWQGVGLAIERLFAGSPWNVAAFAVLVAGVNLLFVALLRRTVRALAASREDPGERR